MLDAITSQLTPTHRTLADRSIAATAGALFGLVFCGAVGIASGRVPFSLDFSMLTLYASAIPLSIAGFMVHFSKAPPKLPILATLWFLAVFVPGMYLSESWSMGQALDLGGLTIRSESFVGFRAIIVAVLSGVVFSGIKAEGGAFQIGTSAATDSRSDWNARHQQAISRLGALEVDLRQRRVTEESELAAFDRKLNALLSEDVVFEVSEEEIELTQSVQTAS